MKSDNIKQGLARTPHRGLLYAAGVSKKNLNKPFIGIASSFSDLVPGHVGMRDLERQIEKGIHSGGGQSFIFGVPAVCDGIAMGHDGMRYSLPSRDLIADCIETVANAHQLDGLVLLSNCDKITPAMLIAAARINIPTIIVTAGPMLDGESKCEKLTMISGSFEAIGKFRDGVIDEKRLLELEESSCPSAGSCQGLYTANTMAVLTETIGMSLVGCAAASAVSAKKRRIAFDSGLRIMDLVRENILPKDIVNGTYENKIIVSDDTQRLQLVVNVTRCKVTIDSLKIGKEKIKLSYMFIPDNLIFRLKDTLTSDSNNKLRFIYYKDAINLFKLSPLVGLGGEGFKARYQEVQTEIESISNSNYIIDIAENQYGMVRQ
jgi:hypothetical protein